jgi:hypothetical protein
MTIIGDATTWSVTSDGSRGVVYDRNIFIIKATRDIFTIIFFDLQMGTIS